MYSMDGHFRHGQIKEVLAGVPRGTPFGLPELEALGVSRQLAAHYAASGWLFRLGHGAYSLPGDELTRDGTVRYLQQRVEGLHVAGKSALSLHGVRHFLSHREKLVLWGDHRFDLPNWLTERFPARYVFRNLFDWPDTDLVQRTISTPPGAAEGLKVSVPERALLELLDEVGGNESLEEARNLFEGVRNLRQDVVGELLSCCSSVKVVRLFLTLSRETGTLDVDELRKRYRLRVGSNSRWMNRLPDGTLLTLKPYGQPLR